MGITRPYPALDDSCKELMEQTQFEPYSKNKDYSVIEFPLRVYRSLDSSKGDTVDDALEVYQYYFEEVVSIIKRKVIEFAKLFGVSVEIDRTRSEKECLEILLGYVTKILLNNAEYAPYLNSDKEDRFIIISVKALLDTNVDITPEEKALVLVFVAQTSGRILTSKEDDEWDAVLIDNVVF